MQSYRAWFNFALIESVKKGFWMLAFYLGSLEFYNYQSKLASMIIILIYDRTKTIFIRKSFSSYFGLNLVRIKGLISVLCCISSISSFSLMLKKKKKKKKEYMESLHVPSIYSCPALWVILKIINLHAFSCLPHLIRFDILQRIAEATFVDMSQCSLCWEAKPKWDQVYL